MGKEGIFSRIGKWFSRAGKAVLDAIGPNGAAIFSVALILLILVLGSCAAFAAEPADNGVHASDQTEFQGFVVTYAPVIPPAVVFYWFTYDQSGEQVWFVSENVPVNSGNSEDRADLFKPVGSFASDDAAIGEPVGELAISRHGDSFRIRFGISPIDGFDEDCAAGLTIGPVVSPMPPPLPEDEYPCRGALELDRVTPVIPELE